MASVTLDPKPNLQLQLGYAGQRHGTHTQVLIMLARNTARIRKGIPKAASFGNAGQRHGTHIEVLVMLARSMARISRERPKLEYACRASGQHNQN